MLEGYLLIEKWPLGKKDYQKLRGGELLIRKAPAALRITAGSNGVLLMGVGYACDQKSSLRTSDLTKKRSEVPTRANLLTQLARGSGVSDRRL